MFSNVLARKYVLLLTAVIIVLVLIVSSGAPAYADSQASSTVSLQYFMVQVQYPATVMPGANALVHIQAVAKSAANLNSLNTLVYYADGMSLHQIASAPIVGSQNVAAGNTFTKDLQVVVPQGTPRTSLFATFTESVKMSYVTSYSYYPYYYGNVYACSYYPAYGHNYTYYNMQTCYYYYPYYNSYNSYPTYSYSSTSDTGVSTLSYVNATTPEYNSLLSQYQFLQSQNQNLQQRVNQQSQQIAQLQAQNQQLQQNLQNTQDALSQKNSDNSNLSSQLTNAQSMNRGLTYLAGALTIIAVLAAILSHRHGRPKKTQSVNPYAANYRPLQSQAAVHRVEEYE
jgi:hypothetical protein